MTTANTPAAANTTPIVATLSRDKECKGSVRFVTEEDQAPISNVYLSRAVAFCGTARTIRVTIEHVD